MDFMLFPTMILSQSEPGESGHCHAKIHKIQNVTLTELKN